MPTLDVDLIWHVHMLSPNDYRDDTLELCGRVLPHETSFYYIFTTCFTTFTVCVLFSTVYYLYYQYPVYFFVCTV